jgi:hypothetical protein
VTGKPNRKLPKDLRSLARGYTDACVSTLGGYVNSPDIHPDTKIAAAKVLLDRGWGRPPQSVEHTGKDGESEIKVIIRTIVESRK